MHRELTGPKGLLEVLEKLEAADRLLAHGRSEQDVAALPLALSLVQGGIGVLDELDFM
jgi:hypothetical protein